MDLVKFSIAVLILLLFVIIFNLLIKKYTKLKSKDISFNTDLLKIIYSLWLFLFTLVPWFFIIYFSFSSKTKTGFTLDNYIKAFSPVYMKVFFESFELAVISTIMCFIVAFPAAFILTKIPIKKRNVYIVLFVLPLCTNFLLRTYSWINIFRTKGLINTILINLNIITEPIVFLNTKYAVIVGMVYNFLPFMLLPIFTSLSNIKQEYVDSAMDLGCNKIKLFFKIYIPLSMKGIVSGAMLVMMPAISTFIISDLLGGSQNSLIGNLIQREFLQARNFEGGSAFSVILIAIILFLMFILKSFAKKYDE